MLQRDNDKMVIPGRKPSGVVVRKQGRRNAPASTPIRKRDVDVSDNTSSDYSSKCQSAS